MINTSRALKAVVGYIKLKNSMYFEIKSKKQTKSTVQTKHFSHACSCTCG